MKLSIPISSSIFKFGKAKLMMATIAIGSLIGLLYIDQDKDFWPTILLPVFYLFSLMIFSDRRTINYGIGSLGIVLFYGLRMCIFPLIIAYGNFYFEPNKTIYIGYYLQSVLLMGVETILVFLFLRVFISKSYKKNPYIPKQCTRNHSLIFFIILIMISITTATFYFKNIDYYHFITEESKEKFLVDELRVDKQSGIFWYLSDYLSGLLRILFTSYIIYFTYEHHTKHTFSIIILISILNMCFLTDRRIIAILVASFILFYYLKYLSNRKTKIIVEMGMVCMIAIMGYYFLYNYAEQGGKEMISRSIQRYFSGPSLSALGLAINDKIKTIPSEFVKLLFNDFQLLVGLFGRLNYHDYVALVYWPTNGIWTPFVVGSIRYFGILFPIPLIFCVWCIVKWDSMNRQVTDLYYSMIYSYISYCISFFLIMYTIELVYYFIISKGLILTLLTFLDKHWKINVQRYNLPKTSNMKIDLIP